jgi:hypothetical protein
MAWSARQLFVCAASGALAAACATMTVAPLAPQHDYCFDGAVPQRASADDLHVFDPYIGRFRGATQRDEASGREFYFTVEYAWFGAGQRVVRYRVAVTVVNEPDERILSEGYYGYDPFNERLYVLGVFASGVTGFGAIGEFDRATHHKSTWACQIDSAGNRSFVRDSTEVINADSWRNVTRVRQGPAGDWVVVTDEIMTRMAD